MKIPEVDQGLHILGVVSRVFHDLRDVAHEIGNEKGKVRLEAQKNHVDQDEPPDGTKIMKEFSHVR